MMRLFVSTIMACAISNCWAQSQRTATRQEAEYYVNAYAAHYRVPVALVRADGAGAHTIDEPAASRGPQ
ncbi:MAG: hypothetical protein JWO91_1665 [Acidobacteriaceae bacterium]|nr:hypothetical protein [Acidobacteriaceae bacterium]